MKGEVTSNDTMSFNSTLNLDGLSTVNQEAMFHHAMFNSDTPITGKAYFTSDVVEFAGHVD